MQQPTIQLTQHRPKHAKVKSHPAEVVCVVDDDPSIRKSVGRLLELSGFKALTFSDPSTFLEYLGSNPVPAVVLDIWMEGMTGMELLAHLCARSPRTKVIFMTGREDRAAETTVMSAGASGFFIKPFDNLEFLTTINRALGHPTPERKRFGKISPIISLARRSLWSGARRASAPGLGNLIEQHA